MFKQLNIGEKSIVYFPIIVSSPLCLQPLQLLPVVLTDMDLQAGLVLVLLVTKLASCWWSLHVFAGHI